MYSSTLRTAICLLSILTISIGCDENRLDVDVSQIEANVEIERIDQLWSNLTPVSYRTEHPRLLAEYPLAYTHYVEDVLQLGAVSDSNLFESIRSFTTHPDFAEVFTEVNAVYSDMDPIQAELDDAWKHYKLYFPNAIVPKHLLCVGGFNSPYIMTENEIGICLELFLGKDCKFYEYLQWPLYQRARMSPNHVVPWMMKGWLETDYPLMVETESRLLDEIIHQGKIFYCLDALFPKMPDSIKIGYTAEEMHWAITHESMVWTHFVDNELLFTTEPGLKGKFINDGPFTVDLVKESPSRMGHFIGWQMVREYMETQEIIDLQLLLETPADEILKKSKYKP
ncbi:MAG TPA: hypothetical protein DCX14_10695 [Flavobacteriales bacterium]|jgi:hypothetical protein|nr:hypothetical protein [Flavobacteriales bacterium]